MCLVSADALAEKPAVMVQCLNTQIAVPAMAHFPGPLSVALETIESAILLVFFLGDPGQVADARV